MDRNSADVCWTEDQWSRVLKVVSEEAQRARVGASFLPTSQYDDPHAQAIAPLTMTDAPVPPPPGAAPVPAGGGGARRLWVDSDPTLHVITFSALVYLRNIEVADPDLGAALGMFRRVANSIARVEDAFIFRGKPAAGSAIPGIAAGFGGVTISDQFGNAGLLPVVPAPPARGVPNGGNRSIVQIAGNSGGDIVQAIVSATLALENQGQNGPYACVLSNSLFLDACSPNTALILPRDRILPFVEGRFYRSSTIPDGYGLVVSLSGSPIELVVVSDLHVRFLHIDSQPRYVFRVSERVALRLREESAIAVLWR